MSNQGRPEDLFTMIENNPTAIKVGPGIMSSRQVTVGIYANKNKTKTGATIEAHRLVVRLGQGVASDLGWRKGDKLDITITEAPPAMMIDLVEDGSGGRTLSLADGIYSLSITTKILPKTFLPVRSPALPVDYKWKGTRLAFHLPSNVTGRRES